MRSIIYSEDDPDGLKRDTMIVARGIVLGVLDDLPERERLRGGHCDPLQRLAYVSQTGISPNCGCSTVVLAGASHSVNSHSGARVTPTTAH